MLGLINYLIFTVYTNNSSQQSVIFNNEIKQLKRNSQKEGKGVKEVIL